MKAHSPDLESEQRLSAPVVLAALFISACLLIVGAQMAPYPLDTMIQITDASFLLFIFPAVGWLLLQWNPSVGSWYTVWALAAMVFAAHFLLELPGTLALAAIPVALAVAMINFRAAVFAAIGESVVLVALLAHARAELSPSAAAIALLAIWATLGVLYTMYRMARAQFVWAQAYYERALQLREETQDNRAELNQALESLSNANRQLALASERANALRTIAEEAQRAKTAFVANVSHEFRTPLNMIIGLVELMVENPEIYDVFLSPEMRKDLEVVHRNCEHLSKMINDVLDLTRMEAGRLIMHRERVDLAKIIDDSVTVVRPLLEKKKLAMEITIPEDLPKSYCDPIRIQQVVLNLISNAARCTERGSISLEVIQHDQELLVSVRDTGRGIAPGDVERIFEPFWQGADRLRRQSDGSGLGLSISRQFVKLHGGRMWVSSELGIGSIFFFTLPISPPLEHIARPGHQIREDWIWREHAFKAGGAVSGDELVKPRVVICDEKGALYPEFVRRTNGVEFIDTRNLTQVAQALRECPAHLIVLNVGDSDDPWPLVEGVKQQSPGTPIVGCAVPRPLERAIDVGALGHLIKPVKRVDLENAIRSVGKPVNKVLVVDDDPEVLRLFTQMLRVCDSGLEIVTASSGTQALDELQHSPPDLLLLDIIMPDMDGWGVLAVMGQDERIGDVPTFFVSAQDTADQPTSRYLLATMDDGLSIGRLLNCFLELSTILLKPEQALDPTPV